MVRQFISQATSAKIETTFRFAFRAFSLHLAVSLAVAACISTIVLGVWFPYPYRELAGGVHLFLILVGVDVICGPVLTAVLAKPSKSRKELVRDLTLVVLIQLSALAYGVYSLAQARPVMLVFEVDRMVTVTASQIDPGELAKAPEKFRSLSWTGPLLAGVRKPINSDEMMSALDYSLQGVEPSSRPGWWQNYSSSLPEIKGRLKKASDLMERISPEKKLILATVIEKANENLKDVFYLPLTSKRDLDWVILFSESMEIVGYAPIDGF